MIDLLVKMTDIEFGLRVHLGVVHRVQTVSGFLADLAHHDHRSLDRRQTRQDEIQEDKRVSLDDAREKIERWRQEYNRFRPHSSLDDRTAEQFRQEQSDAGNL